MASASWTHERDRLTNPIKHFLAEHSRYKACTDMEHRHIRFLANQLLINHPAVEKQMVSATEAWVYRETLRIKRQMESMNPSDKGYTSLMVALSKAHAMLKEISALWGGGKGKQASKTRPPSRAPEPGNGTEAA